MTEPQSQIAALTSGQITAVPFDEIVLVLRRIMEQVVPGIFKEEVTVRKPPNLVELLQRQPLQEIWQKLIADPDSRDGMEVRGIASEKPEREGKAPYFDQILNEYIQHKQKRHIFEQALINRELGLLSFRGYDLLPDLYWPLAANAAWQDGEFQIRVGYAAWNYLRHTEILTQNESSIPSLSTNTFWALLLMLEPEPQANTVKVPVMKQRSQGESQLPGTFSPTWVGREAGALRTAALIQASAPGWAEFWDQWLIAQAIRAWQPSPSGDVIELFQGLLHLSVVNELLPDVVESYRKQLNLKSKPSINLARPYAARKQPGWYTSKNKKQNS